MALLYPDNLEHNNPNLPLVDDAQIGGGLHVVDDITERDSIPDAKRKIGMLVSCLDSTVSPEAFTVKKYSGPDLTDPEWEDPLNWEEIGGGSSLALGETSVTAYRGDRGKTAYDHSQAAHAPSDAEKNVNADWNSVTGDAEILNKPTIPTVVAASEIAAGIAELATQGETNAGSDDSRIVTPLKLKTLLDLINSSLTNPHGHLKEDNTYTRLTFSEASKRVTIASVASPAVPFDYYIYGVKYTTTDQYVDFTDTEGFWFFALDTSGDLIATQDFAEAVNNRAITAGLYWDATNNKIIYQANERHSVAFPHEIWEYLHKTEGTHLETGGTLSDITADGDGSSNSHATFQADITHIWDEDIEHTLTAQTTFDILYRSGASGVWRRAAVGSAYGVYFATRANWNELTGGSWSLAIATSGNFVLAHVFATNNILSPFLLIMGQAQYNTLTLARAGANNEMSSLVLSGLPSLEFAPLATLIYETKDTYANAVKSRIRTTDTGAEYISWIGVKLTSGNANTDHNNLTNLQLAAAGVTWGHVDATQFATWQAKSNLALSNNGAGRVILGTGTANTIDSDANLTYLLGVLKGAALAGANLAGGAANWLISDATGKIAIGSIAASETVSGITEIATQAETDTGTDDSRFVTPAKLKSTSIVLCPDASLTVKGKIELATQTEVNAGSDTVRAVTPATLASYTGLGGSLTLANGTNNYVVTASGAASLNGEAKLQFDGSTLSLFKSTADAVPALGDHGTHFEMLREQAAGDGGVYGLTAGVLSSGDVYLQVQRTDGTATKYNLEINPNGGAALFHGGAEALPTISFLGDTNTGFWAQAADVIGVSLGGDEKYRFTAGNLHVAGDVMTASTTTPSDERLKENIHPIKNALNRILKLVGVTFNLKADSGKATKLGLIAQEVEKIFPELVKESELLGHGVEKYKTIDYSGLIPVLIEALKAQQEQIDEQQDQIDYLRNHVINSK